MNAVARSLRALERGISRLEAVLAGTLLLLMAALAFTEVLLRNLFSTSLSWSDILLRQGVLWITMLGASLAATDGRHIKLDILSRIVPEGMRSAIARGCAGFLAVVCAVLAKASWVYLLAEKEFETTLWGEVQAWPFETILPAGFALLGFKFLLRAFLGEEE